MAEHDDIRARLAACPSFAHQYTEHPTYTGSGCAHCGISRWAHHYHDDVAALLRANEALAKALREAHEFVLNEYDEPWKWVSVRKCIGDRQPMLVMWKVMQNGNALAKDGTWEHEPIPSSRDDEFYERCRFDTFGEAMEAARAALAGAETGAEK